MDTDCDVPGRGGISFLGKRQKSSDNILRCDTNKRLCTMMDLKLPVDQSIIISPSMGSPGRMSLSRSSQLPLSSLGTGMDEEESSDFTGIAVHKGELIEFSLSQLLSSTPKWVMIVFFPQHFTWVRPEMILPFCQPKIFAHCEVIACSHDSQYALLAWYKQITKDSRVDKSTDLYLLSDLKHEISSKFSVIIPKIDALERSGNRNVGMVVLDNRGRVRFSFSNLCPSQPRIQEIIWEISVLQQRISRRD